MPREINSTGTAALVPAAGTPDDFKSRLLKLIPSEIITAYVTLYGLITGAGVVGNKTTLLWIVFVVLLILTPFYLYFTMNVKRIPQIVFTTIAFVIWVLSVGWPEASFLSFPSAFIGSIILILYTLIIPLVYK